MVYYYYARECRPCVASVVLTTAPSDEHCVLGGAAVTFGKLIVAGSPQPRTVTMNVDDTAFFRRVDSIGCESGIAEE